MRKKSSAGNKDVMIARLNEILESEYTSLLRAMTHASVVRGLYSETLSSRLDEIANDELAHARMLRERVTGLGGIPTTQVRRIQVETKTDPILAASLKDEKEAVVLLQRLLKDIPREEVLLYETIEHILQDEQEHLEELQRLVD